MKARGFTLLELSIAIAIVGILAALSVSSYRNNTCRTSQTEALGLLRGVATLEANYRAERDTYATVATSCAAVAQPCIDFSVKGKKPLFTVSATGTTSTFTATAVGNAGTSQAGAVWRLDQAGVLTDVSLICRSIR